jgi:hypothetical protein
VYGKKAISFFPELLVIEIETLITVFTEAMYWIPDLNQFAASEYPSDDISNTGDILYVSFLVKTLEPNSANLSLLCG